MVTRREFIGAAATSIVASRAAEALPSMIVAERVPQARARPVVVASANGMRGVAKAYEMLTQGADTLDAILEGVKIQELDPEDMSVGLGGLPNEDGVVQLDASCMHGPTKRAGAVACLEEIATPSLVAKAVMDHTDHILLVGDDAKRFALKMGFKEQELLTERSRQAWLRWKASRGGPYNWLTPPAAGTGNGRSGGHGSSYDTEDTEVPFTTGTINMNCVNAAGDISSVTTTSGISWKIAGRVGDSPIIGAGQYCDNTVGAAGSTGRGEANIKVCGAFLAVEFMRQGMAPEQALLKVMERVIALTEPRLLDDRGRPYFDLAFYAVARDGRFAGATAYSGGRYAVCDAAGARLMNAAYLFPASDRPRR
jgi:N4-(beta-N-acetylglucosaminyl)-L-asparaginase